MFLRLQITILFISFFYSDVDDGKIDDNDEVSSSSNSNQNISSTSTTSQPKKKRKKKRKEFSCKICNVIKVSKKSLKSHNKKYHKPAPAVM